MGQRFRLKVGYDISGLVIATAMKNFGVQGAPNAGWVDGDLAQLKLIPGSAFEAVDTGPVRTS